MEGKGWIDKLSAVSQGGVEQDAPSPKVGLDPGLTRLCCGSPVEPQLARAQDHFGGDIRRILLQGEESHSIQEDPVALIGKFGSNPAKRSASVEYKLQFLAVGFHSP